MQHPFLSLILLAVCCFGCKKIATQRPPCDTETITIPRDTLFLSTPLVIPTRIIEEKLNRSIGRYILNDDDFDNLNMEGKIEQLNNVRPHQSRKRGNGAILTQIDKVYFRKCVNNTTLLQLCVTLACYKIGNFVCLNDIF